MASSEAVLKACDAFNKVIRSALSSSDFAAVSCIKSSALSAVSVSFMGIPFVDVCVDFHLNTTGIPATQKGVRHAHA